MASILLCAPIVGLFLMCVLAGCGNTGKLAPTGPGGKVAPAGSASGPGGEVAPAGSASSSGMRFNLSHWEHDCYMSAQGLPAANFMYDVFGLVDMNNVSRDFFGSMATCLRAVRFLDLAITQNRDPEVLKESVADVLVVPIVGRWTDELDLLDIMRNLGLQRETNSRELFFNVRTCFHDDEAKPWTRLELDDKIESLVSGKGACHLLVRWISDISSSWARVKIDEENKKKRNIQLARWVSTLALSHIIPTRSFWEFEVLFDDIADAEKVSEPQVNNAKELSDSAIKLASDWWEKLELVTTNRNNRDDYEKCFTQPLFRLTDPFDCGKFGRALVDCDALNAAAEQGLHLKGGAWQNSLVSCRSFVELFKAHFKEEFDTIFSRFYDLVNGLAYDYAYPGDMTPPNKKDFYRNGLQGGIQSQIAIVGEKFDDNVIQGMDADGKKKLQKTMAFFPDLIKLLDAEKKFEGPVSNSANSAVILFVFLSWSVFAAFWISRTRYSTQMGNAQSVELTGFI